jgi:uncharacterized protein
MWELYDNLIDGIPEDLMVEEVVAGSDQAYIKCRLGAGFGMSNPFETRPRLFHKNIKGASLKEVAACIKSFCLTEAAIGQAALNAYYNAPSIAKKNGVPVADNRYTEDRLNDPFIFYQNAIRGKNVAVVGHFHYLEKLFKPVCNLSILESEAIKGDYPLEALEYLLPTQDFVFLTSSCFADKTLPRILELSKAAHVVMVGPTTTLAPVLFAYGIDDLAGFVIKDTVKAGDIAAGNDSSRLYCSGQKVSFKKGGLEYAL